MNDKQWKKVNTEKTKLENEIHGMNKDNEEMSEEFFKNTMYLQKNLGDTKWDEKVISRTATM